MSVDYSGYCGNGLNVAKAEMKCALYKTPFPSATVDMLEFTVKDSPEIKSVLVKHYDYLLAPQTEQMDELGLRESMLFSPEVRRAGDDFILNHLNASTDYLSAHLRRGDFVEIRPATALSVDEIVSQLIEKVEQVNALGGGAGGKQINNIFIATDGTDTEKELIAETMGERSPYNIIFFNETYVHPQTGEITESDGFREHFSNVLSHPGKKAMTEMWIAARASDFIGSSESRFTFAIQAERTFMGFEAVRSNMEFCSQAMKESEDGCKEAPLHRFPEAQHLMAKPRLDIDFDAIFQKS